MAEDAAAKVGPNEEKTLEDEIAVEEEPDSEGAQATLSMLKSAFKQADQSGDGLISADELHAFLAKLQPDLINEDVKQMLEASDLNKDGSLSFSEFFDWLMSEDGTCLFASVKARQNDSAVASSPVVESVIKPPLLTQEGAALNVSWTIPEVKFEVGDTVVVQDRDFYSANKKEVLLKVGIQGLIMEIDEDGDFNIMFSNIEVGQWVTKRYHDRLLITEKHDNSFCHLISSTTVLVRIVGQSVWQMVDIASRRDGEGRIQKRYNSPATKLQAAENEMTSISIVGLQPGREYEASVVMWSDKGWVEQSPPSLCVSLESIEAESEAAVGIPEAPGATAVDNAEAVEKLKADILAMDCTTVAPAYGDKVQIKPGGDAIRTEPGDPDDIWTPSEAWELLPGEIATVGLVELGGRRCVPVKFCMKNPAGEESPYISVSHWKNMMFAVEPIAPDEVGTKATIDTLRDKARHDKWPRVFQMMVQGVNPDGIYSGNETGYGLLHITAQRGDRMRQMETMLQLGANPNLTCKYDRELCPGCSTRTLKVEVEGWTPLHQAASAMSGNAAETLVNFGADLYRENSIGETALDVAYEEHGTTRGSGWSYPKGNVVTRLERLSDERTDPNPPKPSILYKKTPNAPCGPPIDLGAFNGHSWGGIVRALKEAVKCGLVPGIDVCTIKFVKNFDTGWGKADRFWMYGPGEKTGEGGSNCWTVIAPGGVAGDISARGYNYAEVDT